MKAVFVNYCHPDIAHVCGLRAGRFAQAMADRGHQVVVLCANLPGGEGGAFADSDLAAGIESHDWRQPFVLPCPSLDYDWARQVREGVVPAGRRHAAIAWSYLKHSGMFPDWQAGAGPYLDTLAQAFKPDVVWGTFGNTDTWRLAQRLAAAANCPWIGDFKDSWRRFLPSGLAHLMARRFRNMDHMTTLSEGYCDEADAWFPHLMKTVIYSGAEVIDMPHSPASSGACSRYMTISGSVYREDALAELLRALDAWNDAHAKDAIALRYAGQDGDVVNRIASGLGVALEINDEGFMAQDALLELLAGAAVNAYVYEPKGKWHQKLPEFLAAGRPVLSFPGETIEAEDFAAQSGGVLFVCTDATQITDALDTLLSDPPPPPNTQRLQALTWPARAEVLEGVLERTANSRRSGA